MKYLYGVQVKKIKRRKKKEKIEILVDISGIDGKKYKERKK